MMRILLPRSVEDIMRAACVEVFPKETLGALVGWHEGENAIIKSAYPYQVCLRHQNKARVEDEEEYRIEDYFDMKDGEIIGDFHSHPNGNPTAGGADTNNLLAQGDGAIMLILGIWPSKLACREWNFRTKGYCSISGRLRLAEIVRTP